MIIIFIIFKKIYKNIYFVFIWKNKFIICFYNLYWFIVKF